MSQSNVGRYSSGDSEWWRLLFLAIGLLLALLASTTHVVGGESSVWRSDFKAALQEAEEKKLPLLIHFYADWCMPCQKMEREVFPTAAVKELLDRRFVAVKVNSDHRQDLVRQYGVETLPSDVVIDSLTGRVIVLHAGYQDRSDYLATATKAEAHFVKAHASDLVAYNSVAGRDAPQTALGIKSDQIEFGEPTPVIGLDGFSPVRADEKTRMESRFPQVGLGLQGCYISPRQSSGTGRISE